MAQPSYIAFQEDPVLLGNGLALMGYHMDGRPYFANCYSTTSYLYAGGIGVYSQPSYSERTSTKQEHSYDLVPKKRVASHTTTTSTVVSTPASSKPRCDIHDKNFNNIVAKKIGIYDEFVSNYSDALARKLFRAVCYAREHGIDSLESMKHTF